MAATSATENRTLKGVGGGAEEKPIPLHENVMQKHAAFFDTNHDGVIYPWETYKGLREIGVGILLSIGGTLFINVFLSRITRPGKFPSPLLPIEVKNIQLGKHGSDTGVYDTEGRIGSFVEWHLLYKIGKDKDGLLQKETIRGVYDGSVFEILKKEHSSDKNN
ncbi:putative peroxygenase [Arachis hypogaea]|nr:putative peroxygenase [Arachis hypogaea]